MAYILCVIKVVDDNDINTIIPCDVTVTQYPGGGPDQTSNTGLLNCYYVSPEGFANEPQPGIVRVSIGNFPTESFEIKEHFWKHRRHPGGGIAPDPNDGGGNAINLSTINIDAINDIFQALPGEITHFDYLSEITFHVIPAYDLNISYNSGGSVTHSPLGDEINPGNPGIWRYYDDDTTATITATPDAGYQIKHWIWDGKITWGGGTTSVDILMDNDNNIEVVFELAAQDENLYEDFCHLNLTVVGNGTYSLSPNGSLVSVNRYQYASSQDVDVTATPDTGYNLVGFTVTDANGTNLHGPSPSTVTATLISETFVTIEFETGGLPATYDLTTTVASHCGGSLSPSGTTSQAAGSIVDLIAILPSGTGWSIDHWQGTDDDLSTSVNNSVTMSSDKTVLVWFAHADFHLTTSVSSGQGTISPASGDQSSGSVVTLQATPEDGWEVSTWSGSDDDSITSEVNTITMCSNSVVSVSFVESAIGDTVTLTTVPIGGGAISPSGGTYFQYTVVTCVAVPSYGYYFKSWLDIDSDMTVVGKGGIELEVTMSENKTVTALFERLEDVEKLESNIFYCPSEEYKSNVVKFNYTNATGEASRFHFRLVFHSDSGKGKVVYSAFSLLDVQRWYIDDGGISPLDIDGIFLGDGEDINIIYDPEVYPPELIEKQKWHEISIYDVLEKALICGVKYYVDIEFFSDNMGELKLLETITLIYDCSNVGSNYWRENTDKNNWICSGQGKLDLRVANTGKQSLFPSVSSNLFGHFLIAWQSLRENNSAIYGAIWNSEKDMLYSSGQGLFDKRYLSKGQKPKVITDQAQNFYISGHIKDTDKKDKIYVYKCSMPVILCPSLEEETPFDDICHPGYSTLLDSSIGDIKMRIYDEDIDGSLVINKNKSVSVVSKKDIRLDVLGISGAYAIRLRNSDDISWSDWINIESDLYLNPDDGDAVKTSTDEKYDAYFIDNERFVVPWEISRMNGIRRICCQILTFYGISKVLCLDIFVNMDMLSYVVGFYWDSGLTSPVSTYKGYPVLSELKDANGAIISSETTIYVKIKFNIEQEYTNELQFNVIQQGVDDQYNLSLEKINSENKSYKGSFKVYKNDDIFNKDGKGFIEVVFPDDPSNRAYPCISDLSDKYNIMISQKDIKKYNDEDPEQVFNDYKSSQVPKTGDINSLKQIYNKDDGQFMFGNPKFYMK